MQTSFILPIPTPLSRLRQPNSKLHRICSRSGRPGRTAICSAAQSDTTVRIRESVPIVLVTGSDCFDFVNGMGTNAFSQHITEPVQTVFTSNIGRCVDLVTAFQMNDRILLLSELPAGRLYEYLDRYLFPADQVELDQRLIPRAVDVLSKKPMALNVPKNAIALPTIFGSTIFSDAILQNDTTAHADNFPGEWIQLLGALADERQWEDQRIFNGIPKMGIDITSEDNPLEAGLWDQVSFSKGCYIGQETIARLNTYDGVKKYLCLLELEGKVEVGQEIRGATKDERPAGRITSVCSCGDRHRALGYIRAKSGLAAPSSKLSVGNVNGVTLDAPFLRKGYENRSILTL